MAHAGAVVAGRYRLGYWLATGGMGEVWAGVDELLDRPVAVKLVKPEYADDPVFRERLVAEARSAAAVHHPRVVAIYDVGEDAGANGRTDSFIVMELLSGRSLAARLAEGPLTIEETRRLLADVGAALAAAHDRGVIHRDIKPANLICDPDGAVTVLDFGIARAARDTAMTAGGAVFGTARYLSPEQAAGKPAIAASDVYALAVVAHQCLTGVPPFDAESDVATALAHLKQPPPPLPSSVHPALAELIMSCLAKRPADRPTAADVAAAAAAAADANRGPRVPVPAPRASGVPVWLGPRWMAGYAAAGLATVAAVTAIGLAGNQLPAPPATSHPVTTVVAATGPAAAADISGVVPMPDHAFRGMRWNKAAQRLRLLGFHPRRRTTAGGRAGHVARIFPTGFVPTGRTISVYLYTGGQAHKPVPHAAHRPRHGAHQRHRR